MHLRLTWPHTVDWPLRENFFLGGWHPSESLMIEWTEPPATIHPSAIQAEHWFLLSNVSLVHAHKPGLIHATVDTSGHYADAVAFRGYLLDPPIHSYSPSQRILQYWQPPYPSEHNGVFSAACIRDSGRILELITDAFGMAPLYYRAFGELILFATNPRYLTVAHDPPDYLAWRCLIQAGFIAADRTLSTAIKRVPAGSRLSFQHTTVGRHHWFDYAQLPEGTRRIDAKAIAQVEAAFQNTLSRCLQLQAESLFLPLSSGHDSRRILAGLRERKTPFTAATVRVLQKEYRDLDAQFASLMAKELGFPHRVITSQNTLEYARDDYARRMLVDAESGSHTWAVRLMSALPDTPTLFWDGLAGDALGESGFFIPGLHESPETDKFLIAHYVIGSDFDSLLQLARWPSAQTVRDEIMACIASLPEGFNQAELAFLLLHTRRATSVWAQQMLPAGHVVVCPYLDLEYLKTTLAYHPGEKYRVLLQKACLSRYWPQYFSYPGSRAIPPGMPPGDPRVQQARDLACFRQLQHELQEHGGIAALTGLLRRRARFRLWMALKNDRIALRSRWAFQSLMEIIARESEKISCWNLIPER